MTSWPWMKGIDVAIADPIPATDVNEKRPSVKCLIDTHREVIDQIKTVLSQSASLLYNPSKHDDLWILRFVMSHKKNRNEAIKAAIATLHFREEHGLDREDIRGFECHPHAARGRHEALRRFSDCVKDDAFRYVLPDATRGTVGFLRVPSMDMHKLADTVDEKDWLITLMYMTEWNHQWLDYVTRTTGRLTKNVRIADVDGFTFGMFNKENHRRQAAALRLMEDKYPQLLQKIFVCNAPSWFQVPWRMFRSITPKRIVEKIDFVDPLRNEVELRSLYLYISEDNLPSRFGGKNEAWPVTFPLLARDTGSILGPEHSPESPYEWKSPAAESEIRVDGVGAHEFSVKKDIYGSIFARGTPSSCTVRRIYIGTF